MKKRSEVDFEDGDDIKSYIDDVETLVNDAIALLNEIDSISVLNNVEECRGILENLSGNLY